MARGTFITLEGTDGTGKSTQAALLVRALEARGREVVALREPGGTPLGEKIRGLLLDPANGDMAPACELLLYEAARAQLVSTVIEPALARGAWVVCDRFFDSTSAYQSAGRGLPAEVVGMANALGSCNLSPDLTILLDMDPAAGLARACSEGAPDRLEAEGARFQALVREGYLQVARQNPGRVAVVGAQGTPEEVHGAVMTLLADKRLLAPEEATARD